MSNIYDMSGKKKVIMEEKEIIRELKSILVRTQNEKTKKAIETIINEYEYSGIFPDGLIGQSIEAPFLKKITIIENIKGFVKNLLKKYM